MARRSLSNTAYLILATVFWGFSFTWAKAGGAVVNHNAGLPDGSLLGPVMLLAIRFSLAAIIWLAVFPAARRHWTLRGTLASFALGLLLSAALVIQHLGLDRTSEAVTAFLTALTILFVPLLMALALRRPPRLILWVGVLMATIGIWIMTGASPSGFGTGEWLSLACAFLFAVYIIELNQIQSDISPWHMTAVLFLTVGIVTTILCPLLPHGSLDISLAFKRNVLNNLVLVTIFPTLIAFGIMTHIQPRVDPSRAALIYLLEPVFACLFALGHAPLSTKAWAGAALILAANALVEILDAKNRTIPLPDWQASKAIEPRLAENEAIAQPE